MFHKKSKPNTDLKKFFTGILSLKKLFIYTFIFSFAVFFQFGLLIKPLNL